MRRGRMQHVGKAASGFKKWVGVGLIMAVAMALAPPIVSADRSASAQEPAPTDLPERFSDTVTFGGLQLPTAVAFTPGGKAFVAEKSGIIKVYDGIGDRTPTTFADLRRQVLDNGDRGLLGLAVDPGFPREPYVYALYTHDAPIGGTAPVYRDACGRTPSGEHTCIASARLSRLTAAGDRMQAERVLIEDWCTNFPSHSVGTVLFGPDGSLYAGAGDGANPSTDYGQRGAPVNPCGDPPTRVGTTPTPPRAAGGSLRSQDLLTPEDPVTLDGTIIRVDPETGRGWPGNPLADSTDANARRIVAMGLRNPFRFTLRPGTEELWVGDVGRFAQEEIDRLVPQRGRVPNAGWPCYEAANRLGAFDSLNFNLCEDLYQAGSGAVVQPYLAYRHGSRLTPGEDCRLDSGDSITGGVFYTGRSYPSEFRGAYVFGDYAHECLWYMPKGSNDLPDRSRVGLLSDQVGGVVQLATGPGGDLFYVRIGTGRNDGQIRRISYQSGNRPPVARIQASRTGGSLPLEVVLDGSRSSDPEGGRLSYAWDLDDNGSFETVGARQTVTFRRRGTYTVRLRVRDPQDATGVASVRIVAGISPPVIRLDAPQPTMRWSVGQRIPFAATATTRSGRELPASALSWSITLQHCLPAGGCHRHPLNAFDGVRRGSIVAPEHDYPAYIDVQVTAEHLGQTATRTVRLRPRAVELTFRTDPSNLRVLAGQRTGRTPFRQTFIAGASLALSTPSPQTRNGVRFTFGSWSDGGGRTHQFVVPARRRTLTASFGRSGPPSALLLVQNPKRLNLSERAVRRHVHGGLGFQVETRPTSVSAERLQGHDVVLVTPSTRARALGRTLRRAAVGVVTWQAALLPRLGMTGPRRSGRTPPVSSLTIHRPGHALAAGQQGTVRVTRQPLPMTWGAAPLRAQRIAMASAGPARTVLFGYEAHDSMVGARAPARRVGLFPSARMPSYLNRRGWRLFEAAVRWAAN